MNSWNNESGGKMVDHRKLEHQINLSGSHSGKFEDCRECKRRFEELKKRV